MGGERRGGMGRAGRRGDGRGVHLSFFISSFNVVAHEGGGEGYGDWYIYIGDGDWRLEIGDGVWYIHRLIYMLMVMVRLVHLHMVVVIGMCVCVCVP